MDKPKLAQDAALILDNPAYNESFHRLEQEIIRKLAECPLDGSDDLYRDKLHMMLKLHYSHRQIFTEMISSGKLESRRIEKRKLTNRAGL